MADDKHYVPGDFYRIDDRTGFKTRASRTRKEWTGMIVDKARWEARQPQDFVKGVTDNQNVPDPRPRQPNVYIGFGTPGQFQVEPYSDPNLGTPGPAQCFNVSNLGGNGSANFYVLRGNSISASSFPSNVT